MDWPEPLFEAMRTGNLHAVRDAEVHSPEEQFARGVVRSLLGAEVGARSDLEAVRSRFPDEVAVGMALLDFCDQKPLAGILAGLDAVLGRAPEGSDLEARTLHVKGRVLTRRGGSAAAIDVLHRASTTYRRRGDVRKVAEVHDTLGMVHEFARRFEAAAASYGAAHHDIPHDSVEYSTGCRR